VLAAVAACGRYDFEARTDADASGGDAASDAMVAAACGTASLIADTFDTGTISPQWYFYANGGISTTQTGGELVVALPATTSATTNYGGYNSAWHYDVRGSRMYIEVLETTSAATNAQTDIQFVSIAGEALEIGVEAGRFYALTFDGTNQTVLAMIPYVPAQHRWWQLRESAGTVYFEYSADGTTYTQLAMTPTPAWAPITDLVIEAGSFQTENNPGQARFDNLNGGTTSGTWCPASTQRDDFSSGVIGDRWGNSFANGCTYSESGGVVQFALTSAGIEDCALVSATGLDLTGDAMFTALTGAPAADPNVYTFLRASTQAGDNVEVALIGSTLVCAQNLASTYSMLQSVAYSAAAHKFWRLTESAGAFACQTSPDGATWTNLYQGTDPIAFTAVNLAIGTGTSATVTGPGDALFSTVNQLPP